MKKRVARAFYKAFGLLYGRMNPIGYAKRIGVSIGEECRIVRSPEWGSEPYLISIGNHTEISFGCAFITHDGATWVLREKEEYRKVVKFGRIAIGNNCFIGARTILLPGVQIGNDCVVAAGSVVSKSIPDGEIWGGVPARFIMKLDAYARHCLDGTPEYDLQNLKRKKKEEVLRIVEGR